MRARALYAIEIPVSPVDSEKAIRNVGEGSSRAAGSPLLPSGKSSCRSGVFLVGCGGACWMRIGLSRHFAFCPELRNIYSKYLWGFPLRRFDFVGIAEFSEMESRRFSRDVLGSDSSPVVMDDARRS